MSKFVPDSLFEKRQTGFGRFDLDVVKAGEQEAAVRVSAANLKSRAAYRAAARGAVGTVGRRVQACRAQRGARRTRLLQYFQHGVHSFIAAGHPCTKALILYEPCLAPRGHCRTRARART
jgi:hypothetical protein